LHLSCLLGDEVPCCSISNPFHLPGKNPIVLKDADQPPSSLFHLTPLPPHNNFFLISAGEKSSFVPTRTSAWWELEPRERGFLLSPTSIGIPPPRKLGITRFSILTMELPIPQVRTSHIDANSPQKLCFTFLECSSVPEYALSRQSPPFHQHFPFEFEFGFPLKTLHLFRSAITTPPCLQALRSVMFVSTCNSIVQPLV